MFADAEGFLVLGVGVRTVVDLLRIGEIEADPWEVGCGDRPDDGNRLD